MHRTNPALDCYVRAALDIDAMKIFGGRRYVSRYEWEKYVRQDTTTRLLKLSCITVTSSVVWANSAVDDLLFPSGTRPGVQSQGDVA